MNEKILIVDDEPRYLRLVEANLLPEGYHVLQANNGQQAVEMVALHKPDLVMLDVMMPILDGFQALERIRDFSSVPVIIVSAKGEEQDRVRGLNLGADDYILKPFSASELLARVRAVLRRIQRPGPISEGVAIFRHGNLTVDFARAEVFRDDKMVYLSATEYRVLLQLVQMYGKVVPSDQLLKDVWGDEYTEDKEILWVSISRLRQKLEDDPRNPVHVVTRSGVGYIMPKLDQ
jgi:DNA-binding response OmpR family regulator